MTNLPDDCGITSTNDDRVKVLWEQRGRTVTLDLAVTPGERPPLPVLPNNEQGRA